MDKKKLLQQCSDYFKNNQGFNRVMVSIKDKYKSLGKLGGTITLNKLTMTEKEALTGFIKNNYYKDSVRIKIQKFQDALEDSPFKGVSLVHVLEIYFDEKIITKREEKSIYEKEKEDFFISIINRFKDTKSSEWLKYVLESRKNAYNIIMQRYGVNSESLRKDLYIVLDGLNNLPYLEEKKERLALFSSRINKNPHTFDENTECGKLIIYGISYFLSEKYPHNAEERAELFYKAGIIKDEISNFTMCSGLLAYTNRKVHEGWKGFYNLKEPIQVSLWNLSKIDKVICPSGKIFVFENPTVFSEVLYGTSDQQPPLMCTYGQVKLASLILLDILVKQNTTIYYSGDFDPEGLIIGDKLKSRYGKNLILWRYDISDYKKAISNNIIDNKRLKKMDKLNSKKLITLKECIISHGKAGYQELLIDEFIRDISEILKQ